MIEYSVYAHVDGVDLQLMNKPIEIVWNDDIILNISIVSNGHELKKDEDFIVQLQQNKAFVTFSKHYQRCQFVFLKKETLFSCTEVETFFTFDAFDASNFGIQETSKLFDVIYDIQINTSRNTDNDDILQNLLSDRQEMKQMLKLIFLMYHKMCQVMVNYDGNTKRQKLK